MTQNGEDLVWKTTLFTGKENKTDGEKKVHTHTHTRFTSLLGLSQCWRVQYSILMQSWHTKPFVGPLPPWLWAILPMMILPAGFIKGFQPRRKCWKHQENTDVFTCFDHPCSQIFGEKSSFTIGWSCPTSVCMRRSRLGGRARATVPTSSSMSWRIRSTCLGDFLLAFGGQISKMVYSRMCLTMGDYDGDLSNKI